MARFLVYLGILLLLHSTYSAVQHKKYLTLVELPFESLPLNITLECLLSLIICTVGLLVDQAEFKPIRINALATKKTWDMMDHRPSFILFNHRGTSRITSH
eukprot:TRINITY_DN6729_c0_g1_i1.p1 TRINITY_DN6729_c0_g1~~TRINITY_DN6729_c0_g1_i1.p1  ORF type:complete len:101 (+),score=18.81 TRINITY_DN6729_c0_g1_i1:63-365(+)